MLDSAKCDTSYLQLPFRLLISVELQDSEGKVDISGKDFQDPYLKYGGSYTKDPKNSVDFKYVEFSSIPKFTTAHKSAMAKHLSAEVNQPMSNLLLT